MADESHDCSEMAKVPGSSAYDGFIININSGKQGDVVTGVGRDNMKNITVAGSLIKDVYIGGDFNIYDVNPSEVPNQKRSFAKGFNTHDERFTQNDESLRSNLTGVIVFLSSGFIFI